jgi:hypothetical protein
VPYGILILLSATGPAWAAPKPVPPSPYLAVVYRYADARLKHGRDTFGPKKTGLFLSALDRKALAPLKNRPAAPAGMDESLRAGPPEGPLVGANPQHDQNFLRLLYTLSELSFKQTYRDAADAELKWFLVNSSAAKTAAWDEYLAWNVMEDWPIALHKRAPDAVRPWLLWDRCFELSPDESKRLVFSLPETDPISPRHTGFAIRALAMAYKHTKDEAALEAIEARIEALQARFKRDTGAVWLSATIDCGGAATYLPQPLGSRLRAFAALVDQRYCAKPPNFKGLETGASWKWVAGAAMGCVSRYENTGNVAYRQLIQNAADVYRDTPPEDADLWPMVFGHAISLELAAWRSTARREYLDAAIRLADFAVKEFWADSPLPRASLKTQHFESVTGADSLALALVELHLHILHITAVRAPPNTIDR